MKQVTKYRWPSGDFIEIAVLEASFDELLEKFEFVQNEWLEDGLGMHRGFGFARDDGDVFLVSECIASPEYGLNLIVDTGRLVDRGTESMLDEALTMLALGREQVTWQAPDETVQLARDRLSRRG